MTIATLYAEPLHVTDINDCVFYQTMDVPGYGEAKGLFDLRGGERDYLGNVNLAGKSVLEIGPANAFFSLYMERQGADVTTYDLSPERDVWDCVPYARSNYLARIEEDREMTRKLNNAFWLCHRAYGSNVKKVYGPVYTMPQELGIFDVSTLGCVLLHLRDPFLALQNTLAHTRDTVVITEILPKWMDNIHRTWMPRPGKAPFRGWQVIPSVLTPLWQQDLTFLPDGRRAQPTETWWAISPYAIRKFLRVFGFDRTRLTFHLQQYEHYRVLLYTIVGQRTVGRL